MILPPLQGTVNQNRPFIYTACDSIYFNDFGRTLINSIKSNTNWGLHFHLFNPHEDQLKFCTEAGISSTFEYIESQHFDRSATRWAHAPAHEPERSYYERTLNSMTKGKDHSIHERMQKTYYACARFIRLAELLTTGHTILSIDVDAVVRSNPQSLPSTHDFYLYQITGKKARILAGGMYLHPTDNTQRFLKEYSLALQNSLTDDYIYWGLDQDLLDSVVPKYNYGQLPMSYIDWNMHPDSCIWTAKGTRKDDKIFIDEKQKYIV